MSDNLRKAFRDTATFQKGTPLPHFEAMGFWEETVARRHGEGLPEGKKMLESGGYFPSIDHHVPADISFENFCYYMGYLRKVEEDKN